MDRGSVSAGTRYQADVFYHNAGFQLPVLAGNVFCTLTPPAGTYRVTIHRIAYGTGTPAVANNGTFKVGSTDHVLSSAAGLDIPYVYDFYLQLDGSTPIQVVALNNGSNNIGVSASITASRIN